MELDPNERVVTEPGAMTSMEAGIDLRAKINGGIFRALLIKLFGSETFFINSYKNISKKSKKLVLSKRYPGEIKASELAHGQTLYLQPGAFIACTKNVTFSLAWAGISSFLARIGLFKIEIKGPGTVWYGAYGAIIKKQVKGSYLIDSGHLLSYSKHLELSTKLAGGIFSSFFGGEGLILKVKGEGTIELQTRSVGSFVSWLNPKFWS
jgi:uncharacterized protein (TIGR00266 family)